jgi:hypothetical protein
MATARVIPVAVFETRALGKPCGLIRLAVLVADTVGEPSGGAITAWPIASTGGCDRHGRTSSLQCVLIMCFTQGNGRAAWCRRSATRESGGKAVADCINKTMSDARVPGHAVSYAVGDDVINPLFSS